MRNIIGHRIRLARQSIKLTQEELAIKLQILGLKHTRNTVAKIEGGFRQITDIEIKAISDALGVPINWLFKEED
jgi:transcriptional regulator with XRE-family HTH domain